MAWRVSDGEVREILDSDDSLNIAPFIDTATALTDYVSAQDTNSRLNAALLKEIEKNLAAHFYALKDTQYQEKRTEKASAVFYGKTGMGLDFTPWGQTAKLLDVTGTLDTLSTKKHQVALTWLGYPPSSQTAYRDRD